MPDVPIKFEPDPEWPHFKVWERIDDVIYSIPTHFETELLIKGINKSIDILIRAASKNHLIKPQQIRVEILAGLPEREFSIHS